MKNFILDEESLKKGWGAENEVWFSLSDYSLKSITEFENIDCEEEMDDDEYMLSLGYIPYFNVNRVELAKSYIESVGSQKLKDKLHEIKDEEFIEYFWKWYKVYPHLAEGYEAYTYNFLIGKAVDWCNENSISYTVV